MGIPEPQLMSWVTNCLELSGGRLFYAASAMACTPNSLSQEVGLGLGAQAGEGRLRDLALQAGFAGLRLAARTPVNLVLEVQR